jgi:two-component system, NtrC family, sensor kinase
LTDVAQSELAELLIQNAQEALRSRTVARCNYSTARDGNARHFEFRCSPSGTEEVVFLARDVTETKMMESQLLQAQKLESIGQLAAGIAHEINTPLQFIGDNVHFAGKGISSVLTLLNQYSERLNELVDPEEAQSLRKQARKMKLSFLLSNLPTALSSSAEGVGRVAEIVAAMKEFSHPGSKTPTPADINRALRSTTKVSTNEWKHVADLELDLDESIPQVSCVLGEVNQCFLNIIVNASHALKDKYGDEKRGVIQISTKRRDSGVEIRIQDNGPGIPESTRQRIFDPFFTTKEVGKGTGQGLAIARSTIVDKHHGELVCESTVGEGTTFVIYLPYEQPGAEATEDDEAAA